MAELNLRYPSTEHLDGTAARVLRPKNADTKEPYKWDDLDDTQRAMVYTIALREMAMSASAYLVEDQYERNCRGAR